MNNEKNVENKDVINNSSQNNNQNHNMVNRPKPKPKNIEDNHYHSNPNRRMFENNNQLNNNVGSLPKDDDLRTMTNPSKPKPFAPTGANVNSNLNSLGNRKRKNPNANYFMGSQFNNEENVESNSSESKDNKQQNNSDKSNKEENGKSENPNNVAPDNSNQNKEVSKLDKLNNSLNKVKGLKNKAGKETIKNAVIKKILKNPYVLIFLLGALILLLLLIIIIGFFTVDSAYGSIGGYCTTKQFDISDLEDTSVKTFEYGLINWNNPSPQYTFFTTTETYTDSDGFLRSGDAYVVALGTYFGEEKGTKYLVTLENGKEFTIILGDTKSDNDTDSTHRYAKNGDIIEFMSGCGNDVGNVTAHTGDVPKCGTAAEFQSKIYELFPGNIKSIELVDSARECNFNGQFYERNSSIYTDQNAINRILEIAPGVAGNYAPSLRYECVTYAKLRAIEILDNNKVLTDEQRAKAIAEVGNAQGNGWQWTAADNPGLKNFNSDSSCTNFKAGSIIAYNGNGAKCTETIDGKTVTHYCGHVAIIESVDLQARTYTISDSYKGLNGSFRKLTLKIDDKDTSFGGCRGITYLLEYKG